MGWGPSFSGVDSALSSISPEGSTPKSIMEGTGLKPGSPQMSAEEKALIAEQTKALHAQQQVTAAQFHYRIDDNGDWSKMSDSEWYGQATESERKTWDIYQKQLGRYNLAMEGALPLSAGMETARNEEFKGLKASGGVTGNSPESAKATDTIGAQRLNALNTRWANIKEQENQAALGMAGNQVAQGQNLVGMGSQNPMTVGNTSGYSSLLDPYTEYNRAKYQYQAQQQNNMMGYAGLGIGLYGALAKSGAAAAVASSRKFKKDIKTKTNKDEDKALKSMMGTRSVSYKYRKEMGIGSKSHIGVIAEESPDEITNSSKTAIDLGDKLEMVAMSVKAMNRKMDKHMGAKHA